MWGGATLDTPRLIQERLSNIYTSRGEKLSVSYITGIRDFKPIRPDFNSLRGAWNSQGGIEAPHSFTYARRECQAPCSGRG